MTEDEAGSLRRTARQAAGAAGEARALVHLQRHGLVLVEQNFSCKVGEIDLIMRERQTIVFVEVRTRADARHGNAADSVTPAKQRRLLLTAQRYLQRYRLPPACRFDVVAIDGDALTWLKDAIRG